MYEIDELLKKVKRVHFIGIGGSGMCPLAEIMHKEGYILSGSDNNETDTLARIRSLGIPVTMGQKAENIRGAEMIIYTAALLKDNPELVAAKESGIPTFERSKLLGAVTRMYPNALCVSGTHGKTTTCSMLTQVLIESGFDPTAVIGGKLPLTGS
ncbi:MAG: UDP-N-acetylmuramate--L-alanine ligase, partial [Clostridia bacterium]|nr:UDP-N-acetylmuramate--L-alanine ligase [Clostridia bacterium]